MLCQRESRLIVNGHKNRQYSGRLSLRVAGLEFHQNLVCYDLEVRTVMRSGEM